MAATSSVAPQALPTAEAYREMRTRLHAFIARRVASPETAEDLTQDVMLRLVRQRPDELADPVAWLYRVARNALIDHYRRRRDPEPVGDDRRLERVATGPSATGPITDDPFAEDPDDVRRELAQCLPPLVEHLPEPYRSAVRAVDLDGVTHAAAAGQAGISVPGMKSRVQRGRRQLRQILVDCCVVELSAGRAVTDYSSPPGCSPGQCG